MSKFKGQFAMSHPVFVFGSNRQGHHGAGAALFALRNRGAIYRQAKGLQGNSYAIVTKELRSSHPPVDLKEIKEGVKKFLNFAKDNPELEFQVTPIGCGLAGFTPEQIAPLFKKRLQNVLLSEEFLKVLEVEQ